MRAHKELTTNERGSSYSLPLILVFTSVAQADVLARFQGPLCGDFWFLVSGLLCIVLSMNPCIFTSTFFHLGIFFFLFAGTLLAYAGLKRLEMGHVATAVLGQEVQCVSFSLGFDLCMNGVNHTCLPLDLSTFLQACHPGPR